jgi:ubiquinone/menaquinone biosynthesis C-methylase UbiE
MPMWREEKMGLADRIYEIIGAQARKPSGWFGKITGHSMAWEHKPLIKWATAIMDIQPTDHVLDVGCGSGVAIKLIAQIAVEGFVAGVDYSEEMVQQALRRNAAAVRAGRVEIRLGDVAALPYDDESFDKVIATETFYFWPDPTANLQEVRRVMRPGGLVALAMEGSKESAKRQKQMEQMAARMEFPLYSGAEMAEMLTAAGFSRAWFESAPEKGWWSWLCGLGVK